jgi:hypothetical protein
MKKSDLLLALQREIQRHDLSTLVDDPPGAAQGGKGVTQQTFVRERTNSASMFIARRRTRSTENGSL